MTPEQWNARTNAIQAFTGAASAFTQANRPTYGPANPVRAIQQTTIQVQAPACAPFCLQQPD